VSKPEFNPFNPEFRAHPYPFYDALRTHEPVHTTEFGMVVLTRYEDVSKGIRRKQPVLRGNADATCNANARSQS
jgi:cytochrome P450